MKTASEYSLPPNPYTRQPIKNVDHLAGRSKEMKEIRYYLSLTAAGQSPHLALIGHRGSGKTSLLNATARVAAELKVLPIRLDMNERKAQSLGRFWYDLYATLLPAMAKAGCWGGLQGTIYADLFRLIHARQLTSLDKVVLQVPFAFACHQGGIETFECPDALVAEDFGICVEELNYHGYKGLALLVDEADCLGRSVSLLQMFRNIFQTVQRCSLLLAGTEAVFPAISEVFSPIPRQFHRIDVKPFSRVSATMDLVTRPLPREIRPKIVPKAGLDRELHELCGGDPAEAQLYCHHMYRCVEEGMASRMSLTPQVFRRVLREYRSNSPANLESVFNAIERLPDKFLFESRWLSRRNLSLEENIRVETLRRDLKSDRRLTIEERHEIALELKEGYAALFNAGISGLPDKVHLIGAPLTAGFWKSFVEVEKGKRWIWDDRGFADKLRETITAQIGHRFGAIWDMDVDHADESAEALARLRRGEPLGDLEESTGELVVSSLFPVSTGMQLIAADIGFYLESVAGRQDFVTRYFVEPEGPLGRESLETWVLRNKELLAENGLNLAVTSLRQWRLPDTEELHRLAWISGVPIPDLLGPSLMERAIARFRDGATDEAAAAFLRMLSDRETAQVRNNLAFCQILLGSYPEGLGNAERALLMEYNPLFELNKGVAQALLGERTAAWQSLRHALEWMRDVRNERFDKRALYTLLLGTRNEKVSFAADLPVDAAALINLWTLGDQREEELLEELRRLYPEKYANWLPLIEARRKSE